MYYWGLAGLHPHVLIQEAIHNIVAFFQYLNLVYLLIHDSIHGTSVPFEPGTIKYHFFAKFRDAQSESDRLNVVREAYRLLVPNGVSPSHVEHHHKSDDAVRSRHEHRPIMVAAYASEGHSHDYYTYNTHQYKDFYTDFTSNMSAVTGIKGGVFDNYNPADLFVTSATDHETVLDKDNPKLIPVWKTPKYMPFGLGYRRCAGEVLNYFITMKLMQRLCMLKFVMKTEEAAIITIAPFTAKPNNIYVA
jgi:hypothetical protein